MTAPWMLKAAELLRDRKAFPTSGLRGMIKVADSQGNADMAGLYRTELARRRQARRTGADQ